MCIIEVAPAGTDKKSKFWLDAVKEGLRCNSSGGFGFAVKRPKSKSIILRKGFFNIAEFFKALNKVDPKTEDLLVVHGRIPTAGKTNQANTHPFVLSSDTKEATQLSNDNLKLPVVFHNGMFSDYSYTKSEWSDTCNITREFFGHSAIRGLLQEAPEDFKRLFNKNIGYNKLAFIFPDKMEPILFNQFVEDNGYFFSNPGYKTTWERVEEKVSNFIPKVSRRDPESKLDRLLNARKGNTYVLPGLPLSLDSLKDAPALNHIKITMANYHEFAFVFRQDWAGHIKRGQVATISKVYTDPLGCSPFEVLDGGIQIAVVKSPQHTGYTPINSRALFSMTDRVPVPEFKEKYEHYNTFLNRVDLSMEENLGTILRKLMSTDDKVKYINIKDFGTKFSCRVSAIVEAIVQWGHSDLIEDQFISLVPKNSKAIVPFAEEDNVIAGSVMETTHHYNRED